MIKLIIKPPLPTVAVNSSYWATTTILTLTTFSKIVLIKIAFAISYSSDLVSPNPGQSKYPISVLSSIIYSGTEVSEIA